LTDQIRSMFANIAAARDQPQVKVKEALKLLNRRRSGQR